jgi:tRNA modification GTPase
MSGIDAWPIALNLFRTTTHKKLKSLTNSRFYHGWIIDPTDDSLIDEVLLLAFKSPKSYTSEDVIEFQCHGGINVTQRILQLCLNAGARHAECGEFTKRAFIGGRIDLTQVEAVLDIISAKTELFSSSAAYNLSGKLSQLINEIRIQLIELLAHIEASLDFPDEVDELPYEDLSHRLIQISQTINKVLNQATDGNILKHGIKITIVGKPNVGKSSLFNYLLNSERAIVTDIPGTTRDILQETIDIDGIPVILTDTAGIRELLQQTDSDYIESIGVKRARTTMNESDLILFIFDIIRGIEPDDRLILDEAKKFNKPILLVGNKADLTNHDTEPTDGLISISAVSGQGIAALKKAIKLTVLGQDFKAAKNEVYINTRHKEALKKALHHITLAHNGCQITEMQDLISIDIKAGLLALDEIVGEVVAENIIDKIFSQFCVGK